MQKKTIELHKKNVDYTLKVSKRARRMRLAVYCDGTFVVTAPSTMRENIIEQFIIHKSQWILDKLSYFKDIALKVKTPSTVSFQEGKEGALAFVIKRIKILNKKYQFDYHSISIKNQKTRWGSCSRKGNLNFNYRIASLPPYLADYIIVHELCHLKEFNHSQKFWNLVGKTVPEYRDIQKRLQEYRIQFL
jgi:predicted metal-dependent hydrolase